jgi:hypothetical protein
VACTSLLLTASISGASSEEVRDARLSSANATRTSVRVREWGLGIVYSLTHSLTYSLTHSVSAPKVMQEQNGTAVQ